jgi:hypothetical protein
MPKRRQISEHEFEEAKKFASAFIEANYRGSGLMSRSTESLWDNLIVRERLADDPGHAVQSAKGDFRLQLALRREVAGSIEQGAELPVEAKEWLIKLLLGEDEFLAGPGTKQSHGILRFVIWETLKRLTHRGLAPTRAPSTTPQHSGADAVAAALAELQLPAASFDAVVHVYKDYSKLDQEKNRKIK